MSQLQEPGWHPPAGPTVAPERAFHPVLVAVAVGAGVAVLGAPLGLVWATVAPEVPLRAVVDGFVYADTQPEQLAAADGWFALLSVPFGVVAAAAAWAVRPVRGGAGLAGLVLGAIVAGLLAWWLGRQVGLGDYQAARDTALAGATLYRPADLRIAEAGWWPPVVSGVPLAPALVAAVTYTMLAAWSPHPGLRPRPGSQPVDQPGP